MTNVTNGYRIQDIEKEISLPKLSQETVLLDLDTYGLKTHNALLSIIRLNAIDSGREHQVQYIDLSMAIDPDSNTRTTFSTLG